YVPLYTLFGVRPTGYLIVCLSMHAVNIALCYRLLLRLTGRPVRAAVATTLWGCAAFHEASVGAFPFMDSSSSRRSCSCCSIASPAPRRGSACERGRSSFARHSRMPLPEAVRQAGRSGTRFLGRGGEE